MAMDYKDYYKILGVSKTATEKEIKAAYRKLARLHHPDVNQSNKAAEEKFKDIGEAYDVLSDSDKRSKYDQYGDQWKAYSQGGVPPGAGGATYSDFGGMGGGIDDLLASLFGQQGGGNGYGGFGGFNNAGRNPQQRRTPQEVEHSISITLDEAFTGTSKALTLNIQETCPRCGGAGATASARGKQCSACEGTGRTKGGRSIFGNSTCPQCGGSGQQLDVCPECHGDGLITTNRKLRDVRIPPGIADGQRIRLTGQGANGGDMYLKVAIQPHARFQRTGDDLTTEFELPYTTAALGGEAEVITLSGPRKLNVPAGTQSGQSFRVGGQGMPSIKNKGTHGNLIAKSKITVPKALSPTERDLLSQLAALAAHENKAAV